MYTLDVDIFLDREKTKQTDEKEWIGLTVIRLLVPI